MHAELAEVHSSKLVKPLHVQFAQLVANAKKRLLVRDVGHDLLDHLRRNTGSMQQQGGEHQLQVCRQLFQESPVAEVEKAADFLWRCGAARHNAAEAQAMRGRT